MPTLPKAARAAAVTGAALAAVALAGPAQASTSAGYVAYGDTGTAVRCVQTAVNVSNVQGDIAVDGIWGARTETAVKTFQLINIWGVDPAHGDPVFLTADGVVGPYTGDVMLAYIADNAPGMKATCSAVLPTTR
ncbi:peptidoglycan-binding domain-containing protein [Streptomyces sp. SID9727]|uniref:peptidoglycan-binding domain-containing protein n=1 Tax=Streptomyces sp. SID9727 TaxID=2706114 RepID=UPI0013C8F159|nr:peptidoglycan-binding domain-containing protein [Streptomyces sp. SID9727]NEC69937.1 peptidoglycan-binding protein [Streptomyces sp. SID9727]